MNIFKDMFRHVSNMFTLLPSLFFTNIYKYINITPARDPKQGNLFGKQGCGKLGCGKPGFDSQDLEGRIWKPGCGSQNLVAMIWKARIWLPGSGSQNVVARIW